LAKKNIDIVGRIVVEAEDIRKKINKKSKPQMKLPIRSLSNVKYRPGQIGRAHV